MFQIISDKTLCLNLLRVRFSFKLIHNVLSRLTCTEYYQFNYNWMLRVYVTFKKTNFHSLFQFKITRSLNLLVENRKYASLNLICPSANKTTIQFNVNSVIGFFNFHSNWCWTRKYIGKSIDKKSPKKTSNLVICTECSLNHLKLQATQRTCIDLHRFQRVNKFNSFSPTTIPYNDLYPVAINRTISIQLDLICSLLFHLHNTVCWWAR